MSNPASREATEPAFHEFPSAHEMYTALAQDVAHRLTNAVAKRGGASMVASGGTTPGPLFDLLAHTDLSWRNVEITLSDDRWIEPTSERSNENLIRGRLLTANAAVARFIPFKTTHFHAHEAECQIDEAVRAMYRPFDVVLLGMGTDGHVASLIPGADGLAAALDRKQVALVRAIHPADLFEKGERMSLTLPALLEARRIVILLRGREKREAYLWAMHGTNVLEAPVRALLHQSEVPVSICWAP